MAPFIHWLPRSWQSLKLLRYCSLYGLLRGSTDETLIGLRDSTRFLSKKEMKQLFPDCEIRTNVSSVCRNPMSPYAGEDG